MSAEENDTEVKRRILKKKQRERQRRREGRGGKRIKENEA